MKRMLVSASVGVVIGALTVSWPTAIRAASPQGETKRVNPNAQAIADFQKRVEEYAKLHRKLESTIPPLPKEATPEQIDAHQRALGRLIQQARKNEAAGAIFDRDVRPVFRRLLHGLFT